jgi:hypothetical protein
MTIAQRRELARNALSAARGNMHLWKMAISTGATMAVGAGVTIIARIRRASRNEANTASTPVTADQTPAIPVYTPTKIEDPVKYIKVMARTKQPYANVHFDMIE